MAKKTNFLPWIVGGIAAYLLLNKKGVSGIYGYKKGTQDKIYEYILHSVDGEGYNVNFYNDKDRIKFIFDTFRNEYGFNIKRYGLRGAFTEWLQGLPTAFNIAYSYNDIIRIGKEMGVLGYNATEKQEDLFIENWFKFITNNTFKLASKYKISTY